MQGGNDGGRDYGFVCLVYEDNREISWHRHRYRCSVLLFMNVEHRHSVPVS